MKKKPDEIQESVQSKRIEGFTSEQRQFLKLEWELAHCDMQSKKTEHYIVLILKGLGYLEKTAHEENDKDLKTKIKSLQDKFDDIDIAVVSTVTGVEEQNKGTMKSTVCGEEISFFADNPNVVEICMNHASEENARFLNIKHLAPLYSKIRNMVSIYGGIPWEKDLTAKETPSEFKQKYDQLKESE